MSLHQGSLIEDVVLLMSRNLLLKSQTGLRVEDSALLSVINQQRRLTESNAVFVDESQKTQCVRLVKTITKTYLGAKGDGVHPSDGGRFSRHVCVRRKCAFVTN